MDYFSESGISERFLLASSLIPAFLEKAQNNTSQCIDLKRGSEIDEILKMYRSALR